MADPLSDVLRSVRLTGGVFLDARFTAPWCVTSRIVAEDCRPLLSAPAQLIGYHVVLEGRLLVSVDGEQAGEVRAGEIVLLPRNESHVLASAVGLRPVEGRRLVQMSPDGGLARIDHGGGGEVTRIVCGFLGSDEAYNPLVATLPRTLTLDVRAAAARDWIEASVRFAAAELTAGRLPTSDGVSRLSEALLIEAVRQYSATLADDEVGWLRGLRDPQIGRALALIHRDLGVARSLDALAREAALSRSAFVERFRAVVGQPPARYATAWRLRAARTLLKDPARSIAQLAHAVGYESEEAFSRAFKREFGESPARWRARP